MAVVNPDLLEDLGRRARRWIAVEELLFETLGGWARQFADPPAQRVFGTWCHRHAWHAELWRSRSPAIDAARGGDDDVDAWIAPLRNARQDVTPPAEAIAVLRDSVLPAFGEAVRNIATPSNPCSTGRLRASSISSVPTSSPSGGTSPRPGQ